MEITTGAERINCLLADAVLPRLSPASLVDTRLVCREWLSKAEEAWLSVTGHTWEYEKRLLRRNIALNQECAIMDSCVERHLAQLKAVSHPGKEIPFLFTTVKASDGVAGKLLWWLGKLTSFSPTFHFISMVLVALQADHVLHCSPLVLASPSLASIALILVMLLLCTVIPVLRETFLFRTYQKAHIRVVQMVLAAEQAQSQHSGDANRYHQPMDASSNTKPGDKPLTVPLLAPIDDSDVNPTHELLNQDCIGAERWPDLLADSMEKGLSSGNQTALVPSISKELSDEEPLPSLCNSDGTLKDIAEGSYLQGQAQRGARVSEVHPSLLADPAGPTIQIYPNRHWVRKWRTCQTFRTLQWHSTRGVDAPRVDSLEHVPSMNWSCLGNYGGDHTLPVFEEYAPFICVGVPLTVMGPGIMTALLILQYSGHEVTWYAITSPILVGCFVMVPLFAANIYNAAVLEGQTAHQSICSAVAATARRRTEDIFFLGMFLSIMLFTLIVATHLQGFIHSDFWPCFVPLWLPLLAMLLLSLGAFPKDQGCVAKLAWVAFVICVMVFVASVLLFPLIVDGLVPMPFTVVVGAFGALPAGVVFFFVFIYV